MAKYIDADKLKRHYAWWDDESKKIFDEIIDLQPAADVQPVRRGRWIRTGEDGYCSICNCDMPMYKEDWEWRYLETPYCPNCGARMEEEA